MILKRRIVPTGEPDNTERVPSGSVGGWGKRSVSYLARSLPNLVPRSRFRRQVKHGVRVSAGTSRHSGEGCKSLTVKVQPTTLAPSHAQASVTASAKR
jgi:hypothetical protein